MERQFGPYRLVRQVAVGGMAEIHLAKARGIAGFEKYVALKMIHPNFAEDEQFIEMLVDEAKIAVQLTHHNIAQTFDLGRVGDTYYISMEYVDGADLYKVLRRASEQDIEFPLDICAFIAKEVVSGLDYAHRKRDVGGQPMGIVHRDVSPQNVLVSYAGEVKLVDFGIAKATMKVKQTAAGVIKGKYYYMSPEQASGGSVDSRSDIFSAGIVLYEMITGQMLYLEEDLHRLLDMVRRADIAPPSKLRRGIPPQLERIVMHALAKTPPDRYQSGADMASDLERFLHAYSPVFTPAKVVSLLRQAVGDATLNIENEADFIQPLDGSELMRAPGELRDSNSVIFRVKPRPLSEGFPHIDTNGATDAGARAMEIGEVEEMAGGGTRSADGQRVEPRGGETKKSAAAPAPVPPSRPAGAGAAAGKPAVPAPPASRPPAAAAIPRVRQSTAPMPSSDGVPRRSPSQPTRPVPSGSRPILSAPSGVAPVAPLASAKSGPLAARPASSSGAVAAKPAAPPTAASHRGFDEDTRELPNDFDEDGAPVTGVRDLPSGATGKPATGKPAAGPAAKPIGGSSPGASALAAKNGKPRAATRAISSSEQDEVTAESGPHRAAARPPASVMPMYGFEDIEGGDSTMVSQIPNFYTETGEVENTFVNAQVPVPEHTDYGETQIRSQPLPPSDRSATRSGSSSDADSDSEDGPTIPGRTTNSGARQLPSSVGRPAALAAKNPTPAMSELRKPRPSRSTPTAGVNVLQAIVAAPGNEPMPATPRRAATPPPVPGGLGASAGPSTPPPMPVVTPQAFEPTMTAPQNYLASGFGGQAAAGYGAQAQPPYGAGGQPMNGPGSGQPMQPMQALAGMASGPLDAEHAAHHAHASQAAHSGAMQQHPGESLVQPMPQAFAHLSSGQYQQQPGHASGSMPMMYGQGQSPYPGGYPMPQSGAFPQGMPAPTATGRMRALELDEIPPHYRIKREGPRWFVLLGIALTAVATAASVTFLVLRSNRQQAISSAALRLDSFPSGASVFIDDKPVAETTPLVYRQVRPSGRYTVRFELPKHKPYSQQISIASTGGEMSINPTLQPLTGRIRVVSDPEGADVFINSLPRGKTPVTVSDLDMDNTKAIELRHPRADPYRQELVWPESGTIDLDLKLAPVAARPRAEAVPR